MHAKVRTVECKVQPMAFLLTLFFTLALCRLVLSIMMAKLTM